MLPIRDRLPARRVPVVNYLLIATNVLVFVWEQLLLASGYSHQRLGYVWGFVPRQLLHAPGEAAITILSSMFMHDPTNYLHIGSNMLFLWIFGDNVEDALGHVKYLGFYLLCGVCAAAAQFMVEPSSNIPMIGASGAIAGVLAAYGSLYPRAPITVLNPVFILWFFFGVFLELPAWLVILEFFAVNLFYGVQSVGGMGGGVAFFAHIGGFVAGLLLVRLLLWNTPRRDHERWQGFRRAPVRPVPTWTSRGTTRRRWDDFQ